MFDQPSQISFQLPSWLVDFAATYRASVDSSRQMSFILAASRENVERETGGPFAAAVFFAESGELVALGVNLVTTQGLSALHAEMVAIALAQRKLGSYDLSLNAKPLRLVCSTEPCAMCLGAIPWSGVCEVVTGARDEDARAIGFDEGTKPQDWSATLTERGITVQTDVLRQQAQEILQLYQKRVGVIYSAGSP